MNSAQWIEKSDKYIMKTYGRYPIVPVRGEGCRLWDADGKVYLDFLAGVDWIDKAHIHAADLLKSSPDDLGMTAVEGKAHIRDFHVTLLRLLGLDDNKLTYYHAEEAQERAVDVAHVVDFVDGDHAGLVGRADGVAGERF